MNQNELKKQVAEAAVSYVKPGEILGVGTGSTVNFFIEAIAAMKSDIPAAVSSSEESTKRLKAIGIPVIDLNEAQSISVYVDGADESNKQLQLLKGGGGALTREKIIAAASETFVCIADQSKLVSALGKFPLPVEVIPMARSFVAHELVKLGGKPELRAGFKTDNGNIILDVHGLVINEPFALEEKINHITGVVTNGLFAKRPADVLLLSNESGVETITA